MKNFLPISFILRSSIGPIGLVLIFSIYCAAQPHLVKDTNISIPQNIASNPTQIINVDGTLLFAATDPDYGVELWRSDGTSDGTTQVKDIYPGLLGSTPQYMVSVNGVAYFAAFDAINGQELWRSDGTTSGTFLVKDIYAGANSSSPVNLVVVGSKVYFSADDGVHGRELWATDGTTNGTSIVKDIQAGAAASFIPPAYFNSIFNIDGTHLFFEANDGVHGNELWKSDGTDNGTVLVKDIIAGSVSSMFVNKTFVEGKLYFMLNDAVHGYEPWVSDGTDAGTILLKDIYPGTNGSSPSFFTLYKNAVYFRAVDDVNGIEVWKTDGTSAGTALLKDINPGIGGSGDTDFIIIPNIFNLRKTFFVMNDILYLSANDGVHTQSLWKSDGTSAGTVLIKDIAPASSNSMVFLTTLGNNFYFSATTTTDGNELWKSDGTAAGTVLVKNISSSYATVLNSAIYFSGDDGIHGSELWKTDGAQTSLVKDINTMSTYSPQGLTSVGTKLYFTNFDLAHGYELWKSDGTDGGTVLVKDIVPGALPADAFSSVAESTNFNGNLLFTDDDGTHGREVWKSDGSDAGTVMVKDIIPGISSSSPIASPYSFVNFNSSEYFIASGDQTEGGQLWKTDGTGSGTTMVKDLTPGTLDVITYLVKANTILYFLGNYTLWKSDGTAGGTTQVNSTLSITNPLYTINSRVFFTADDGVHGNELWTSDGTPAGTVMTKDILPGAAYQSINIFGSANGFLYFLADDGVHGYELWKSDGTTSGTQLVKDISAGQISSGIRTVGFLNNVFYFSVNDGVHGSELWQSDGTTSGTVLIKDINAGTLDSSPGPMVAVGNNFYFAANDGTHGIELWKSDGTSNGTVIVGDIKPGVLSSQPNNLTVVNGFLFFVANDVSNHWALWMFDPTTQGITFDPLPNKLPGDAPFSLTATASSGLPVSFSIISGPATVSGNTVTLNGGVGTVTVQASQAGNGTYKSAPNVQRSFGVTVVLGLNPLVESDVNVFPVPASDILNIIVSGSGLSTVTLFDIQGRDILTNSFVNEAGATISVSSIPKGFYVLEIRAGNKKVMRKVLVE